MNDITPKEAIANLNHIYGFVAPDIQRSLDVAIKALEEHPTDDCINREALKEAVSYHCEYLHDSIMDLEDILNLIDNAPTVEVYTKDDMAGAYNEGYMCGSREAEKARPQGEWIIDGHHRRCKKCGEYFCIADSEGNEIPSNFCPNCGSDMRKGGAE